ncbi:hypothetical protein BsWGS_08014 [Bradybaena similaris]
MGTCLCFSLAVFCCALYRTQSQVVHDSNKYVLISLGHGQQLRGLNTTSGSGHRVYKFNGIPYALPPLADRRFQPPQPEPDWTGVKDAINRSSICPQGNARNEDCLYLNVFTPDVNGSLPVFVWIHGGGYTTGSSFGDGDGATMAPQGVVTVTINYRLGPLGFMSTGDAAMPGNYGMLDQVLALKWVQKYIRSFGGDASQVTIGGESAGAHSVSLLIVSPLTKELFHRAVMESGSGLALTALERPGTRNKLRETTLRAATRVGCNKATSNEVLHCLQKVEIHHLMNATHDFTPMPRIETTFGFMPEEPITRIRAGNYNKVDILRGTNSGEWAWVIADSKNDGVTQQEFRNTIASQLDGFLNSGAITSLVTDAYAANVTDHFLLREQLVHAVADIKYGGASMVETNRYVMAQQTKHYLYEFDYRISGTTSPEWQGVAHAAERGFVFYGGFAKPDDRAMGEAVQKMWANFIKHGDPTPSNITIRLESGNNTVKWNVFTNNNPNMLKIDAPSKLVTYPRLFLIPLFEKILEIMQSDVESTVVG